MVKPRPGGSRGATGSGISNGLVRRLPRCYSMLISAVLKAIRGHLHAVWMLARMRYKQNQHCRMRTAVCCWTARRPEAWPLLQARLADARAELRPIDHGFCLPEALEPPYFEWLHWPQVPVLAAAGFPTAPVSRVECYV